VIVALSRTAVGKAKRGVARHARPDDLAATVIRDLVRQVESQLDPARIEDVILGCAFPEGPQGLNVARYAALLAGLPVDVAALTVNRFCASGLQAIAQAAARILANGADVIVAGGVESMSQVPMPGFRISPNLGLAEHRPEVYMSMGLTAERVAGEYKIGREAQDEFAYHSQRKASAAQAAGRFAEEIVPFRFEAVSLDEDGRPVRETIVLDTEENIRPATTIEALARLKPAFKEGGTVTAGNASPLSDGAAGVIVMEAGLAAQLSLKPLARFVGFSVVGVRPEVMGIGPVAAVPRVLQRTGLSLADLDLIELNEAFAAQSLAVIRELGLDPERVNVNGGAIALGHPLGATGAKLTVQLVHELRRRGGRYGMVTMCIGGGMGAAGIFERVG
jgi:acetyl-CoA acyltransferase